MFKSFSSCFFAILASLIVTASPANADTVSFTVTDTVRKTTTARMGEAASVCGQLNQMLTRQAWDRLLTQKCKTQAYRHISIGESVYFSFLTTPIKLTFTPQNNCQMSSFGDRRTVVVGRAVQATAQCTIIYGLTNNHL